MNQSRSIIRLTIRELLSLSSISRIPVDTKARAPVIYYYYRLIVSDNAKLESVFAHLAKYHYTINEAYHIPFEETTHFIFTLLRISHRTTVTDTQYHS